MARTLETLFLRFRDRGDVAALATVFDRTAPELLRVARHVSRQGLEPEELVQETFLTAIRSAESYDRSRRLLPWLVGILTNHARNAGRKVARAPDPQRLPQGDVSSADTIEVNELTDAIEAALLQVAEPHRAALVLHLRHGMAPAAIAQSLDVAPATARTRVHRGLKQLRRHLPSSVGLASLTPGSLALAPVRSCVLQAAAGARGASTVAVGTTAVAGGAVVKVLLAGVLLLGVVLGTVHMTESRETGTLAKPAVDAKAQVGEGSDVVPGGGQLVASADEPAPNPGPALRGASPAEPAKPPVASKGGVVHGTVRFEGLVGPRPAATVVLRAIGQAGATFAARTQTPDAEGRFRFEALPAGRYMLVALAPGHFLGPLLTSAPRHPNAVPDVHIVHVLGEQTELQHDVRLWRGYDVEVETVDAQGRPLADVRVFLGDSQHSYQWRREGSAQRLLGTSDAAGRLVVTGRPAHKATQLVPQKRGWVALPSKPVAVGPDHLDARARLVMDTAPVLRGRVVGTSGAKPVRIRLQPPFKTRPVPAEYVNVRPDGTFEILAPLGTVTLRAIQGDSWSNTVTVPDLRPGEVREELSLVLDGATGVAGVIVDETGAPLRHLRIEVQMVEGHQTFGGVTDGKGRFALSHVPAGKAMIRAQGGKWLTGAITTPQVGLRLVHQPIRVATITGEILDPQGRHVPFATVMASISGRGTSRGVEVSGGRFEATFRCAPPYILDVINPRDDDGKPLPFQPAHVEVSDASLPVVARLVAGEAVAGVVADLEGRPIAGVRLRAERQSVLTDAEGRFEFQGLPTGSIELVAYPSEAFCPRQRLSVRVGSRDVSFKLRRAVEVGGRVVDASSNPVVDASVQATWMQDGRNGRASAKSDGEGAFTLEKIPEGVTVGVRVMATGGTATLEDVPAGTSDLLLTIQEGAVISGVVLDHAGKPAAGVRVMVVHEGSLAGHAHAGKDGRWELAGLASGPHSFIALAATGGLLPQHRTEPVVAPAADVEIRLMASRPLLGTVRGTGTESWSIQIYWGELEGGLSKSLRHDGAFHFPAVAAGVPIRVAATNASDNRYARWGPANPPDGPLELEVKHGQAITATVAVPEALSQAVIRVNAHAPGWRVLGRRQSDGSFVLRGLPSGTYTVEATARDPSGKMLARVDRKQVPAGSSDVRLELQVEER